MLKDKNVHDSLKARKEDILDMIQNLCDLVRFLDRPNGAANKDFWIAYLEFAYNNFDRLFDADIRNYLIYKKLQKQFGEKGV